MIGDAAVIGSHRCHLGWLRAAWSVSEFVGWNAFHHEQRAKKMVELVPPYETRGERGRWQRRYWEHTVKDEADLARLCDYIHFNPVKHGLVQCPHVMSIHSLHFLDLSNKEYIRVAGHVAVIRSHRFHPGWLKAAWSVSESVGWNVFHPTGLLNNSLCGC